MRISEEAYVQTRPLETGFLKDRGHLFVVRIDQSRSDDDDELVEVLCRLTLLDGIILGSRCICGRRESLRDRDGGIITTLQATNATAVKGTRSRMARRIRWTL